MKNAKRILEKFDNWKYDIYESNRLDWTKQDDNDVNEIEKLLKEQAQAMTMMNPQAQAIACLQITNAYPSTPQAQKSFWDAGNETILDEGTGELCCR